MEINDLTSNPLGLNLILLNIAYFYYIDNYVVLQYGATKLYY